MSARKTVAALALLAALTACAEKPSSESETRELEPKMWLGTDRDARMVRIARGLESRPPNTLSQVRIDDAAVSAYTSLLRCSVDPVDPGRIPADAVLLNTSPDGENTLLGDPAQFGGGDHLVSGEVDGVFGPGATTAFLRTPNAAFRLENRSPLGFHAHYTNAGDALCTPTRPQIEPDRLETLRYHMHDDRKSPLQTLTVFSGTWQGCLILWTPEEGDMIAAFPERVDYTDLLSSLRGNMGEIVGWDKSASGYPWLSGPSATVTGSVIDFDTPPEGCSTRKAFLLEAQPVMGRFGLEYAPATDKP